MAIDINGISSPKVHGATDDSQLKKPVEQQAQQAETTAKSATSDTVSLSENAVQLGKLDNTSISAPVVDTKRVEAVKQAIASGEYEVDPAKIADKMMQFESMLKSKA